jgi:hypothetical protein
MICYLGLGLCLIGFIGIVWLNERILAQAVDTSAEYTTQMYQYDRLAQSTTGRQRARICAARETYSQGWETDPNHESNSGIMRRKEKNEKG